MALDDLLAAEYDRRDHVAGHLRGERGIRTMRKNRSMVTTQGRPSPDPRGSAGRGRGRIYRLADPRDNKVRYVGKTERELAERLEEHLRRPTGRAMIVWVEVLKAQGLAPRIELIREVPTADLDNAEREEIVAHNNDGHPILNEPFGRSRVAELLGAEAPARMGLTPTGGTRRRRFKVRMIELRRRETLAVHAWNEAEHDLRRLEGQYRRDVLRGDIGAHAQLPILQSARDTAAAARRAYRFIRGVRRRTRRLHLPAWLRGRRHSALARFEVHLRRVYLAWIRRITPEPPAAYVPLLLRKPDPRHRVQATYEGGRVITPEWDDDGFFVGTWLIEFKTKRFCLIYPMRDRSHLLGIEDMTEHLLDGGVRPDVAALIRLNPWEPHHNSQIEAMDAAYPDQPYQATLDDLYGVLSCHVPWWPEPMRCPDKLTSWRPDGPRYRYAATCGPHQRRAQTLKRVIATEPAGSPVATVLSERLWEVQDDADAYAQHVIERARSRFPKITVPVLLLLQSQTEPEPPELDDEQARKAWLNLYARTDPDAVACVRDIHPPDRHSPVGEIITLRHRENGLGPTASEWLDRLERSPATAAGARLLHDDEDADTLIDPLTGMWAVRQRSSRYPNSEYLQAYAPTRLPTSSPVAELILDQTAWIRTEDGVLHMAPQPPLHMVTWGYRGNGPGRLAALIVQLLEDPSSDVSSDLPGEIELSRANTYELTYLVSQRWPDRTTFNRTTLEKASTPRPDNPIGWHDDLGHG